GESAEDAIRHTAMHAGPSIITAAATTGLAFFAVMLADFKAVAELGWIAGSGVLFCAASCIPLMPAMPIVGRQRDGNEDGKPVEGTSDSPSCLSFPNAWLPGLANRPRAVLLIGAVFIVVCAAFATQLKYDHNLLNLQPRGLDSVTWEHKLIE